MTTSRCAPHDEQVVTTTLSAGASCAFSETFAFAPVADFFTHALAPFARVRTSVVHCAAFQRRFSQLLKGSVGIRIRWLRLVWRSLAPTPSGYGRVFDDLDTSL
jgi:hypothetical protein